MVDDTRLAVPALAMPADGFQVVIREAARLAIQAVLEEELTAALGREAWERSLAATGYRHGTISRSLVTSAGLVELAVPRGRLHQPDGSSVEWRSAVLPRYSRRAAEVDATLSRLYLSGGSARDLRRAVAPLLGSRMLSKSAISRLVTRLQREYRRWQECSLVDDRIRYLYLDGQRHRIKADGRVSWCSVLMALGVRDTGEKVVLGLRVVGGEQTEAWSSLLEDLTARGLCRPALVISDGSKGAAAALHSVWPGIAHQRCLVHKQRNIIASAPRNLRSALVRDFRKITAARDAAGVAAAVAAFQRTWARRWSAAAVSLAEAGEQLTAFTAFPPDQWPSLRTTNPIERIFGEFKRRTKTQGAFPNPEALMTVLWGTMASGAIRLQRIRGYLTMIPHARKLAA